MAAELLAFLASYPKVERAFFHFEAFNNSKPLFGAFVVHYVMQKITNIQASKSEPEIA